MAQIPLRARDGTVRALALVDDEDLQRLSAWRWSLGTNGYAERGFSAGGGKIKRVRLHVEVMGEAPDGLEWDHINRNPLDCRKANLRAVTRQWNMQNRGSFRGATSSHRGVFWDKGVRKWRAVVRTNGKNYYAGCHSREEDAAAAALALRKELLPGAVD
jgi:hypothetical protein